MRRSTGFADPSYRLSPYGFVSLEGYLDAKVMAEILRRAKSLTPELPT